MTSTARIICPCGQEVVSYPCRPRRYCSIECRDAEHSSTIACARAGCSQSVRSPKSRPRRFCSLECYRRSGTTRTFGLAVCDHCEDSYQPKNGKQRWCWTCLGPAIPQGSGAVRYLGGYLLNKYDVSYPEWQTMLAEHDGLCWLCLDRSATMLDHDHDTGRVRGVLCMACNTALHSRIDSGWLARAVRYLHIETATSF